MPEVALDNSQDKLQQDRIENYDATVVDKDPYDVDIADFNMINPHLFSSNTLWPWFKRLREEEPVHYCRDSVFGPYWSVTSYDDIMKVDTSHDIFSSEPNITVGDLQEDFPLATFIAMDRPKHDEQRAVVNPAVRGKQLRDFEPLIRERTQRVLDSLPVGEEFNWVERVSIELTTCMLATLFDFPFEDRAKLTRWSDVTFAIPGLGVVDSEEQRREELLECLAAFTELWNQRVNEEPRGDFISLLAHGSATQEMDPFEYLGNILLLIIGGNDTTRNSMSGSVLCQNLYPGQFDKLKAQPELIPSMVSETIRWQTPLAYMRRTANQDTTLGDKQIKKGDKVLMWYVSGNRDESHFENPDDYIIDRPNVRSHLSFGFGIHRCMGNAVGEMQLRVLWEEILQRFDRVEVVGDVERVPSSFVKGYSSLPVILHPKK
jgi:cytochrome P450